METISQQILFFLFNPSVNWWYGIIRMVFIGATLVLIAGIIFSLSKSHYLQWRFLEDASEFLTFRPSGVRKLAKAWNKIKARLDTGLESEYKLAVIEADGLMDDVLRRMSYKGENLEERLKNLTSATLSNIDNLKDAHRSRTNVLHNPDQQLSLSEAKKILAVYRRALEDIQAF
jgi:hypothetical protein